MRCSLLEPLRINLDMNATLMGAITGCVQRFKEIVRNLSVVGMRRLMIDLIIAFAVWSAAMILFRYAAEFWDR